MVDPDVATAESSPPDLSVVVPLCNEEAALPLLYERLVAVLAGLALEWELILVDDGSSDSTYDVSLSLRARDERVKVVRLSRNFGHQLALSAGLDAASGSPVVTMDGDLQHPPEVIPEFVARWIEGYDFVLG